MSRSDEVSQQDVIAYAVHINGRYATDETRTYNGARKVIERGIGYLMTDGSNYNEISARAKSLSDHELIGLHSVVQRADTRIRINEVNGVLAAVSTLGVAPLSWAFGGSAAGIATGAAAAAFGALRIAYSAGLNKNLNRFADHAFESAEQKAFQAGQESYRQLDIS